MSSVNGNAPTPARRIRDLMTRVVILPERSAIAGEPVGVRIRIVSRAERNAIYWEIPTFRMTQAESVAYLKGLDGAAATEYQRLSDEADERFLRLAIVAPTIASEECGDPETTIPLEAIWPDRQAVIREILIFSGFLSRPPAAPEPEEKAAAPAAEDVLEEAFRAPVAVPPGDGGALAPPGVGDPGEGSG